jgi:molecular chaperone HtpG
VFIMDDAEQLLPAYLRFVRGVVDSNDLPLNVSREILQESKDVEAIRKGCTSRILGLLEGPRRQRGPGQRDKYAKFWTEFGRCFKEGPGRGLCESRADREAAALRVDAQRLGDADVSLAEYVKRMKDGQDAIYYVTADTFAAAKNSPASGNLPEEGIEVLLLADRVDEWVVSNLHEFDGKPLKSVAKGALDLDKLADRGREEEAGRAVRRVQGPARADQEDAGEKVADVRVTLRLTESPACLGGRRA